MPTPKPGHADTAHQFWLEIRVCIRLSSQQSKIKPLINWQELFSDEIY